MSGEASGGGCRIRIVRAGCPVCGREDGEQLLGGLRDVEDRVEGSYAVSRCPGCGLVYLSDKPSSDTLAACYDNQYYARDDRMANPLLRALFNYRYRLRHRRLARCLGREPSSVLELGCGDGQFLRYLEGVLGDRCRLCGVDLDVSNIRREEGSRIRYVSGALEEIRLDERFDAILLYNVLEHLERPVQALRSIAGWLEPSGLLFVQVPDWDSQWRKTFPRHWSGLQIPRHQIFFDRATLSAVLDRAGLFVREFQNVLDPGDLSVSLCNWVTDRLGLSTKPRRAWFYYPAVFASMPFVVFQTALMRESGQVEAIARREPGEAGGARR